MTPVCVMGGISATAALDWWPGIVGPGGPLDPRAMPLVGFDFLRDRTYSTFEQADALLEHLDAQDIDQVRIVGASYGGMVGLALATIAPERIERLIVLAAAHRPHPIGVAWRSIQRQILDLGVDAGQEERGVALARALAMTTFRTPAEFDARFDGTVVRQGDDVQAPVDSYLAHHGQKYAAVHSAKSFRALTASIDLHRVDPAAVTVPVHLVAFVGDLIVPPDLVRELAELLPNCLSFDILPSIHGHDGFLLEIEALSPVLRQALEAK
ncbi:MAG: alpha/beta fold hydrolase [Myxococcota bacterium]